MEHGPIELVQGILNKEPAAYEHMIERYSKTIYCLAYNILSGSHSREDIEECVADVLLDAWLKIAEFDEEKSNFRTWLLILTKYKALTYRRQKKHSNSVDIEDVDIQDNITVEKQVFLRQDMEQVIKTIHSFQKTDREIFVRRFFLGEKINDLAQAFNLSRSAVDNRLLRGRKLIKEVLQDE